MVAGCAIPTQVRASIWRRARRGGKVIAVDRYDQATRSYVMSRIRGRNTKAEVVLRRQLWARGLRGYRTHTALPGRPDIAWSRARLAIFVDGCFWHGCPKCRIPTPASRVGYWAPKLRRNRLRDRRVDRQLHQLGWTTVRLWEHEVLRDPDRCAGIVERFTLKLNASSDGGSVSHRRR